MKNKLIIIGGAVVAVIIIGSFFLGEKSSAPVKSRGGPPVREIFQRAVALENNNDLAKARAIYKKIITDYPDFEQIDSVQKNLEDINLKIIFSTKETKNTVIHEVKSGDTLGKIAKKYGTTVELIKKSNHLSGDTIRVGQRLRIWTGVFSVLVDKSRNKLILSCDNEVVKVYDVATGTDNNTPVGTFTIVNKLVNPVWFKSGAIIPSESPKNVLGTRWMGFDIPGYGIHGTIAPESIGRQITAGCVRMRNEEVEELYDLLPAGTKVTIVD